MVQCLSYIAANQGFKLYHSQKIKNWSYSGNGHVKFGVIFRTSKRWRKKKLVAAILKEKREQRKGRRVVAKSKSGLLLYTKTKSWINYLTWWCCIPCFSFNFLIKNSFIWEQKSTTKWTKSHALHHSIRPSLYQRWPDRGSQHPFFQSPLTRLGTAPQGLLFLIPWFLTVGLN